MSWTLEYILGLPIFETIAIQANNMPNIQSVSTLTISGQGFFFEIIKGKEWNVDRAMALGGKYTLRYMYTSC